MRAALRAGRAAGAARGLGAAVALALALLLAAAPGAVGAPRFTPGDDPEAVSVWLALKAGLLGNRPVEAPPPGLLTLEIAPRALDASVVPVLIRTRLPSGSARHVSRLFLLIDANPSPITGVFRFTAASGQAEVETRVRVDDHGYVRAVAETSDGRLYAVARFVKAAGGCSAPAGSDAQKAAATPLGQISARVDADWRSGEPVAVQLAIHHPNHSGLAMDPYTRQFTPPHFVRTVEVSYGGRPVFEADVDFGISENPFFRFLVRPLPGAELRATVADSHGRRFALVQPAGS